VKDARWNRNLGARRIAVLERAHHRVDAFGLHICGFFAVEADAELGHRVTCQSLGRLGRVQRVLVDDLRVESDQSALKRTRNEVISRARLRRVHRLIRGDPWRRMERGP
jgi:hypothetical protein